MKWVLLLLVFIAVAGFVFIRYKKANAIESRPVTYKKSYGAVRIKPHEHACDAAFDYSHRVYLASEAPLLPLPDCNKSDSCRCGYVHYDDRRQNYVRRGESIVMREVYDKRERRDEEKHGRRKDD